MPPILKPLDVDVPPLPPPPPFGPLPEPPPEPDPESEPEPEAPELRPDGAERVEEPTARFPPRMLVPLTIEPPKSRVMDAAARFWSSSVVAVPEAPLEDRLTLILVAPEPEAVEILRTSNRNELLFGLQKRL